MLNTTVVEHLRSPRHALQILVGQTPGLPGLNIEAGQMGQPQGTIDQIKVLLRRFIWDSHTHRIHVCYI